MTTNDPIFTAATGGAAGATKVMVRAPQGSMFDGMLGIVVRAIADGTVMVRLDRPSLPELPFGLGELVDVTPRGVRR